MPLDWLLKKDSMTETLRAVNPAIKIEILYEGFEQPESHEQTQLGLKKTEKAFVREVLMLGEEAPWVYARSVFHPKIGDSKWRFFFNFGERPLGEVLFSDPEIHRATLQVLSCQTPYVGRASLFLVGTLPLYIKEIFLPLCPLHFQTD